MYCNIKEAFNNSIKKQLDSIQQIHKQNIRNNVDNEISQNRKLHNMDTPFSDSKNLYNSITECPDHHDVFFSAQGDLDESQQNGTNLEDLKDPSIDSVSNYSFPSSSSFGKMSSFDAESSLSTESLQPQPKLKRKSKGGKGHEYYIRNFIQDIYQHKSKLNPNEKNDVYEHIGTCNYCKSEIELRTNDTSIIEPMHTGNTKNKPLKKKKKDKSLFNFDLSSKRLRNVIILFVIGIILICVLDLFTKIWSSK
jgi:hypothetical protein